MTISIILLLLAIAAVLVWNLVPSVRERMRGLSTVAEGVIGVGLYYLGSFADVIREAQASGYLPAEVAKYAPALLLAWIVLKRFQTTTPVGKK